MNSRRFYYDLARLWLGYWRLRIERRWVMIRYRVDGSQVMLPIRPISTASRDQILALAVHAHGSIDHQDGICGVDGDGYEYSGFVAEVTCPWCLRMLVDLVRAGHPWPMADVPR